MHDRSKDMKSCNDGSYNSPFAGDNFWGLQMQHQKLGGGQNLGL